MSSLLVEAEDLGVELLGLVDVLDEDTGDGDVRDHAATLGRGRRRRLLLACGFLRSASPHMNTKHPGIRGAPVAAYLAWNSLGVSPTSSRNRLLNEPRLEKPTAWQTSVTVRLVARSRSWARSTRRSERYAAGRQPVGRLEQPLEVELAQPGHRGERVEVERLGVVAVGVVAGPAQVHQHVAGARSWRSSARRSAAAGTRPRGGAGSGRARGGRRSRRRGSPRAGCPAAARARRSGSPRRRAGRRW